MISATPLSTLTAFGSPCCSDTFPRIKVQSVRICSSSATRLSFLSINLCPRHRCDVDSCRSIQMSATDEEVARGHDRLRKMPIETKAAMPCVAPVAELW